MIEEEKAVRDWKNAAGVDSRLFMREVTALIRAKVENERQRIIRCIDDNFVNLPDEWHRGHNKALRDARHWVNSDWDPALHRMEKK